MKNLSNNTALKLFAEYLLTLPELKNYSRRYSSYGLKHSVERLSDKLGSHYYTANEDVVTLLDAVFIPSMACTHSTMNRWYKFAPKYLSDEAIASWCLNQHRNGESTIGGYINKIAFGLDTGQITTDPKRGAKITYCCI
jgi:hypothetical protein